MRKRVRAGSAWFLTIWLASEIASFVFGTPRVVGPILAAVVSSLVVADPGGLLWPAPARTAAPEIPATIPAD